MLIFVCIYVCECTRVALAVNVFFIYIYIRKCILRRLTPLPPPLCRRRPVTAVLELVPTSWSTVVGEGYVRACVRAYTAARRTTPTVNFFRLIISRSTCRIVLFFYARVPTPTRDVVVKPEGTKFRHPGP